MKNKRINLFVNWYNEKNPVRKQELDECLIQNIKNPVIDSLIVWVFPEDIPFLLDLFSPKKNSAEMGKITLKNNNYRPTYNDLFKLTENYPSDINIIANTDIIIDGGSFATLKDKWLSDACFALSRWDLKKNEKGKIIMSDAVLFNRVDSQDTWVFFGSVPQIKGADFMMGMAGCDNAIAHLLWESGLEAYNVSKTLKTYHLHLSDVRNYLDRNKLPIMKVNPPYRHLPLLEL